MSPPAVPARLEAVFGPGRDWRPSQSASATAWESPTYHLLWSDQAHSESALRRLWEARKGLQAFAVVALAPSDDSSKVLVAGPQYAGPVRELPNERVIDLLEKSRGLAPREAAAFLTREFSRLEEAVVPGLRVKDLLTPHFLRERLAPVRQRPASGRHGQGRHSFPTPLLAIPFSGTGLPGPEPPAARLPSARRKRAGGRRARACRPIPL